MTTRPALIDTGTQVSIFDTSVADDIHMDLSSAAVVGISGVGGLIREAKLATVTLQLLERPELATTIEVAFVDDLETDLGNLVGLDALEAFDFALSHSTRTGYLSNAASQR